MIRFFRAVYRCGPCLLMRSKGGIWYSYHRADGLWESAWTGYYPPTNYQLVAKNVVWKCKQAKTP